MNRLFRALLMVALIVAGFSGMAAAAAWHHPLVLDGSYYWKQRIRVVVENRREVAVEGLAVGLVVGTADGQANLAGQPAEALRVVDEKGTEMLFALRSSNGELVTRGPIPAGSRLVLPAQCQAKASAIYYVYFDNPAAGEVPDFLQPDTAKDQTKGKEESAEPTLVSARADKPERAALNEPVNPTTWLSATSLSGGAPDRRFAATAFNFTDAPQMHRLATLNVSALAVRTHGQVQQCTVLVNDQGQIVPYAMNGDTILFEANMAPHSMQTWWVYAWNQPPSSLPHPKESIDSLLARLNRVKNPGFEEGQSAPDSWPCTTDPKHPGIEAGFEDPGRPGFGRRCVRLHVPEGAPKEWRGWRQTVAVEPGKTYLLRAWVKSKDLRSWAGINVHLRTDGGELCKDNPMRDIGSPINGTNDWSLLSGVLSMPSDAATLEIHLTTDGTGTLWYDELLLTEAVPATAGLFEGRPVAESQAVQTWPVPAVVKVFPDDTSSQQSGGASIAVARNEKEPVQIAVRSGQARAGVGVEVDPPVGPNGAKLDQIAIAVVGYVPIDYPTNYYQAFTPKWQRKSPTTRVGSDGWRGPWPDPLLPRNTMDLAANQTGAVWVTFSIGKDQPAGSYAGRIRLVHQGRTVAEVPLAVRVRDFALPKESHVAAVYDARLSGNSAHWCKAPRQASEVVRQLMAANRLCPDEISANPEFRYENGKVVADFTKFDAAAEHYFNELGFPHAYMPNFFYLFGWGFPPRDMFGEHPYPGEPPYKGADRSQLRPEFKKAYQACLKAFWDHVKAKGWEKKFTLYISDEPFATRPQIREQMKALCTMIHEVDPQIPIYSSTWHHVPEWDGYLTVWGVGHSGNVSVEQMSKLRAGGARIWFTTDGQMCTDTPYCAIERLLPHYCFKYGADAYEFWGVGWHTYDPYRFGWHEYIYQSDMPGKSYFIRYPNGDGYLLYPGTPIGYDGPVSSVRFEQAREGVEDYEYLYLLRDLIGRAKSAGRDTSTAAQAMEKAQQLISVPSAGGRYSSKILPNPQALYDVRQALAEAIESLPH